MQMEFVSPNGPCGCLTTKNSPIKCPACNSTHMYIAKDGQEYFMFCSQENCLKNDSDSSKSMDRKRKADQNEKNKQGFEISGAEKFRLGTVFHEAHISKWISSDTEQKLLYEWMKNKNPFFISLGCPGSGKTYMSAAVLNLLYEKKLDVIYTSHRRFIEEIKAGFDKDIQSHDIILKYSQKEFLIFDDLGSSRGSEWEQEMILELIDRRYANASKTLITSNLNKDEMKKVFGFRTSSRIFDQHNDIVECWEVDRRGLTDFRREKTEEI